MVTIRTLNCQSGGGGVLKRLAVRVAPQPQTVCTMAVFGMAWASGF